MSDLLAALTNNPIILVFILANIAIGFWAHRKSRAGSFEDYALASRSLPTAALVMTLLGTFLSGTHLSSIDRFHFYGFVHIIQTFFIVFSFVMIGTFIAPKLIYFNNKLTAGGLIRDFYGPFEQLFSGVLGLLGCLLLVTMEISVLGRIAMIVLSIKLSTAIIIFGILTVVYSMLGGLRTVSYTDIMQMIAFFVFLSFVGSTVILKVGGGMSVFRKLVKEFPEKLTILSSPHFDSRIKSCFFWGLPSSFLISPPIIHRMLVTQDKRQVRRMWYGSALIYLCVLLLLVMVSFAILTVPGVFGLTGNRDLLPQLVKNLFRARPIVLGFIFIGMISVILSTIDSFLHTAGIVFVEDIIGPLRVFAKKKNINKRQKIILAKVSIGFIGFFSILGSLQASSTLYVLSFKIYMPTVLMYVAVNVPLILGILGLKTDRKSWLSFSIAYLGMIGTFVLVGWRAHLGALRYYDYFLVAAPLSILVYLLTHLFVNGGFVTLDRKKDTISETLWVPTPRNIGTVLGRWLGSVLHLSGVARREVMDRKPAQSLGFSLLMFTLYMVGSIVLGDGTESFVMFMAVIRAIGIVLCCLLMLEGLWSVSIKKYFPLYWLGTLVYCLPFTATLSFLRMHTGVTSTFFFVGSFMLLALLVSSRAFVWMSLLGVFSAYGGWYVVMGSLPAGLWKEGMFLGAWVVVGILMIAVLAFAGRSEGYAADKLYITKAVAGALPHETTDQLGDVMGVQFFSAKVNESFSEIKNEKGETGYFLPEHMKKYVEESSEKIDGSMKQVRNTFSRFTQLLDEDISTENQEKMSIEMLVAEVLPTLPKKYSEKIKISVVCKKDFEASVLRRFFGNVLINMVKNAHKHGAASELMITIDGASRTVEVRDNGRGIPSTSLPHIFDLGFSTGDKKLNHGVGLALVKMILTASGVRTVCKSRTGKDSYTSFVLTFPYG